MGNLINHYPSRDCPPAPPLNNPTDEERRAVLKYSLWTVNRLEDYENIINLLSPPLDITKMASPGFFKGKRIGIIGGGLAGLSSAFELRKLGFDITIFEANENRIGGRVYTYYFDRDNFGELGPMRIPISHETTWHYINLFKLNTSPFVQYNENALLYVKNIRVQNDIKGINVMKKIYPYFNLDIQDRDIPWSSLINRVINFSLLSMPPEVRREILEIKECYNPKIIYWDSLSIRKAFEVMGYSQSTINMIGSISPLIGSFFDISFIEVLQDEYSMDFIFLYRIDDGIVKLPLSFYKSLTSKAPKEYSIPVNKLGDIRWMPGNRVTEIGFNYNLNKVTINYKDRKSKYDKKELFDYVICAIPFSTLRTIKINPLFSEDKMQAIKEVHYTTAFKSLLLCSNRFWEIGPPQERIIGGGSYTDLPITSIWYPSDHAKYILERYNKCLYKLPISKWTLKKEASPESKGVLLASYNFDLDAIRLGNIDKYIQYQTVLEEIEEVHGLPKGYLKSIVKDYKSIHWNTQVWARGAFCYFNPQQKRLFSYPMALPEYNNRIFFAGEHISSKHAWMQGALNSGMKAAKDLAYHALRHLKTT